MIGKIALLITFVVVVLVIVFLCLVLCDYFGGEKINSYGTIKDRYFATNIIKTEDNGIRTEINYYIDIRIDNYGKTTKEVMRYEYNMFSRGDRVAVKWRQGKLFNYVDSVKIIK